MADASRPPPRGLDGFIDQVATFWRISARGSRRMLDGDYSVGDAAADVDTLIRSSTGYAVRVADDLWGPEAPLAAYDGDWNSMMRVLKTVGQRPLTLRSTELRAIGNPSVRIPPANVTFVPPKLEDGVTEFEVIVRMGPEHRRRTLIFQGTVESEERPGQAVTDPIRANNRDNGPVR